MCEAHRVQDAPLKRGELNVSFSERAIDQVATLKKTHTHHYIREHTCIKYGIKKIAADEMKTRKVYAVQVHAWSVHAVYVC